MYFPPPSIRLFTAALIAKFSLKIKVDELKKDHENFLAEILQEFQNVNAAAESLKSIAPLEPHDVDQPAGKEQKTGATKQKDIKKK